MATTTVSKTVRSNSVAFVDLTDAKKIDVYISSNLPTSQIYDRNNNANPYSPNWTSANLILTPTVYLDGENVTNKTGITFTWYRKVGSSDKELIQNGQILTVKTNELNSSEIGTTNIGVVSYICSATYNKKTSENQITFTRVDTGKDGTSGASAPSVQAQYSVNGTTSWTTTLDPANHKYIRFSYDNGKTWTSSIKIAGEDGKSVEIKGVAYAKTTPVTGNTIDLYSDTATTQGITGASEGDSYLVNGYLCVHNGVNFVCTGQIQGPKGEAGDTYYLFIRYANNANGSGMSASSDGKSYIGFYRTTVNQVPTDTSSATWGWTKFVGEDAKNITLTASAQAFKTNKSGIMSPSTITVTAQTINTTIPSGGWTYSTDGGITFSSTAIGVVQSGNTVTITGASLATNSITIKASDGTYSDLFTVYKISDGIDGSSGTDGESTSIAFLNNENISFAADMNGQVKNTSLNINVVGYEGTTKVVPKIGIITGAPTGMTIGAVSTTSTSELQIPITIAANATLGSTASTNGTIDIPITYPVSTVLKLTWSKINTGAKGENAPEVKAEYSTDGSTGWASVFNASTHKYVHFSYDNGKTWSDAIKMVGDDAKSIVLNADAQVFKIDKSKVITPTTITITAQTVNTSIATNGWTYSTDGGKTFSSTAPTGVTRSGNTITIVGSTLASSSLVVKASDGTYSDTLTIFKALDGTDGTAGADAPIAFLSNENIGFSANAQGQITDTLFTTNVVGYKGITKVTPTIGTISGLPTGMTYNGSTTSSNELVLSFSIANNSTLGSNSSANGTITIPVTSPVNTNLKLSWSKINSGAGVESTTVSYGISDSSSTQPTEWQQTIPTVAEGKYLWTRTIIDYTDEKIPDTVTYTYTKQGIKGDTGSSGSSVTVTSIQYKEGTSATTAPTGTWSDSVVSVSEGKYLWTKTAFSDGKTAYGVAKQGVSGKDGVGINSTTVDYGVSDSATVKPTTWQQDIPTVAEGKYLWTRTVIDYTDTSKTDTVTYVYTKQGSKGDTGTAGTSVTVKSIKYQAGTSATTAPTGTWSDSVVAVAEGNYLWTQTIFSDNKVAYGVAKQGQKGDQGIQGPKGNDSYTIILTNESHIFAGDISNAIAGSATTQVLAYNGSTAQTVTIVSVNGKTAATTDTDTGIAGLKFKCSALSGTSPTITFTCTTSFVSKNGSIPIVLSVGGVQFTKMFTYSIAFKGATGAQGSTGTAASLVNITPSALYFKSTTGKDGTFTPDYIYLYPRFQTVTFSKWEYSVNGGTTWTAASGANGLTISTYNSIANTLRIAKTSTLYTDTVTSISFRCVSSNASIYDTVSIAKIYDVVDLRFEGRNLVLNSNQSVTSDTYRTFVYDMSEDWIGGETYTISIKGSLNEGQTFGVWANGSSTRVTTLTYDASKGVYTSTFVASTSIVTQLPKTLHVYNTPSDTATESTIEWIKLEKGSRLTNWLPAPEDLKSTTFQLYAPKGYLITKDVPEVTLETFAYDGSQPITNATFTWYNLVNDVWTVITGATGVLLTLNKDSVLKSNVYKCEMTYKGKTYEATATIEDKTDVYESIMCVSSNARGNDCYWVLYTLVYTDAEEVDPLLGPISINAPSSPVSGDYWYAVDEANATVQLKKYNGTAWASSADTQSLSYYWDIVNDGSIKVPFGDSSKVQVVSCHDFTATATLVCEVSNAEDGLLTQSSLSLTDASDPIVSATEPIGVVDGQIWIKPNDNGTYFMFIWDATKNVWIANDMDKRTKVYSSRPSSYNVGDLWITASDTDHGSYLGGTLLQTDTTSTTYNASHWSPTLKYDQDLDKIKETLNDLSEYVNITSEGLKISAQNASGEISPFSSLFTSTELAFYQNSDKLLTLANNQLTAPHIVVEDDLDVGKTISLGNLNLTIETNGSFSFAVSK